MKHRMLPALAALGLCHCSVMHFKNGETRAGAPVYEEWHHNLAFSLWEVSKPINLSGICPGGQWSRITTKDNFITTVAGSVDNVAQVDIWDPQLVQWQCGEEGPVKE